MASASQASTTSTQAATNQQVTGEATGGSNQVLTGSGGTTEVNITSTSTDSALAAHGEDVVGTVALGAINANTALAGGAEAVSSEGLQTAAQLGLESLASANETNQEAFALANDAIGAASLNASNAEATVLANTQASEQQAYTLAAGAQGASGNLANELATITANAAPQTPEAYSEISGGSSPLGGGGLSNLAALAVIAGGIVAVVAFFNSKGRTA